jgi:hypothetical protein
MADLRDTRRLVEDGVLDADLLALLWLLLEARTPLVVVGQSLGPAERVVDALQPLLPAGVSVLEIEADDEFAGLPEAGLLGWRTARTSAAASRGPQVPAGVLRARGLAAPDGLAGERARLVLRALAIGYGLLATMRGERLEDALEALHDPAVGASADERSRLGVVLALAATGDGVRVQAAHYVRPVAVDPGGHVHRPAPAVLCTWNEALGTYDDFAWGITPELAGRLGVRPVGLEREQARRAAVLRGDASPR